MNRHAHPNDGVRFELARELHGDGVEFGPGCFPLRLGPFAKKVRYVDAFDRQQFAEQFAEVGDSIAGFPEIDLRLDFDKENFVDRLGRESADFIVANHVLEHLVNPLRFLEQCHAVLRERGVLFLGLPDKRRMFDRDRKRTPLGDVVARYQAGETVLSEERIREYVEQVDRRAEPFLPGSAGYEDEVALHRRRSLHVNVWLVDDLVEILTYFGRDMGLPLQLMDGILAEEEFLFLLRKSADARVVEQYPATLARLWAESHRRHEEARFRRIEIMLDTMDERIRESQNLVRRIKRWTRRVPGARWFENWEKRSRPDE